MQQFTATVTGTANMAVTWSVSDVAGGNATLGTISTSGLYTAPTVVPNPPTVTVRATSVLDSKASGTAAVTIELVAVSVTPANPSVLTGGTRQFTAVVTGTSNQAVTWSLDGAGSGNSAVGTISASGLYTAPAVVPNPPMITVRATSDFDNAGSGTAKLTITSPVEDWPKYRRDFANTGRSAETGLSSGNVSLLKVKWKFLTGGKVSASPAVAAVGGTSLVLIGSWDGVFHGLDAVTGAERWSFAIDPAPSSGFCASKPLECSRIGSSAAVSDGKVYFGAGNGYVYALDAASGARVWGTLLGDPTLGVEIWTSPAVYNGLVFTGVASHEDSPCVPGRVVALDASTGAVVWTFYATDPAVVGVGVWSSPAIDTSVSPAVVYIGTSNPGNSCDPPAAGTPSFTYPDGIVALNSLTGALLTYAPAVTSDINDCCDYGSSPVLHQTSQCGGTGDTSWVTEVNKNGLVFTFPTGSAGILSTSQPPVDLGALNSGEIIASPAVKPGTTASDCNQIVIPSVNGYLFGLQQADEGSVSTDWTVTVNSTTAYCSTPGNCPLLSAPASIADILLFGGGEGNFYAFDTSGNKLFAFGTGGLIPSSPAISHSRVYFGSYDHYVYCLSLNGQ
jgi:outer membrane protein assembly factor BamB